MTQVARDTAPSPVPAPGRARQSASEAERVLLRLFDQHVEDATVRFIIRGHEVTVGRGSSAERVTLRIHDDGVFRRVMAAGNLGLGESYIDGAWDMEEGDISDFLIILLRNRVDRVVTANMRTVLAMLRIRFASLFDRYPKDASMHYDLGTDLYQSFLDSVTMAYTCGYVNTPTDTVEQMQVNKLDRICRKVEMRPGDHVLDAGCGFGGLLIHAATHYGVTGVGITTSRDHCEHGNARIAQAGLADRIRLELRDHRTISGRFDRVVSVGLMEHLPRLEYRRYFERVASVLPQHGTGLVHAIHCTSRRNVHDPFTQKYLWPGSNQPKLSETVTECERQGLVIRDVENIVRHYPYSMRQWLERFRANKHTLDQRKYGPRFQRMWEYYLSCSIAAATASDAAVYQVLFAKDYTAPMPLHRV